jgi:hypothetical protein
MFENNSGIRTIVDRLEIGPRLRALVTKMEADGMKLDQPPAAGAAEVKALLDLVDGTALCAAILAHLIDHIEVEQPEPELTQLSHKLRWDRAAAQTEGLALLLIGDRYYAFGHQAERIAETLNIHIGYINREIATTVRLDQQAEWAPKLQEARLDVTLFEEDGDGFQSIRLLDDAEPEAETHPLDHDEDGRKGGSKKGKQSTRAKGAAKKNKAKAAKAAQPTPA